MLPIVVVGAGPKGAALAAKSKVLRDHGHEVPEVVILEQHEIGANWSGTYGFTTGTQRLGTPPEKDIGFPYTIDSADPNVTRALFRDYSWISYQIFARTYYSEWVDRGRPHPTHMEWGRYLAWVIKKAGTKVIKSRVNSVSLNGDSWLVHTSSSGAIEAQGVMFTGPGSVKPLGIEVPTSDSIVDGQEFWRRRDVVNGLQDEGEDSLPVVVIGGGETAASIVSYLLDHVLPSIPILVLTRSSAIFTRGEGYYENRIFTDFQNWRALPKEVRLDAIRRSDRGVFSVEVVRKIAHAHNLDHRFMEVRRIEAIDRLLLRINGALECQLIVQAAGFDATWFVGLFEPEVRAKLPTDIAGAVGHDLSIDHNTGLPKIFVPMLAGLEQGPGFPNLSCLGTLSDRILQRTPAGAGDYLVD